MPAVSIATVQNHIGQLEIYIWFVSLSQLRLQLNQLARHFQIYDENWSTFLARIIRSMWQYWRAQEHAFQTGLCSKLFSEWCTRPNYAAMLSEVDASNERAWTDLNVHYRVSLEHISWLYAVTRRGVCFCFTYTIKAACLQQGFRGHANPDKHCKLNKKFLVFQNCVFHDMESI